MAILAVMMLLPTRNRDYFCTQKINAGEWCRIPPGTIHSWQGGGNLLVEIAQRSDNTFRILDYARELSNRPRPMHYWEALYALTPDSLVGEGLKTRLIFKAPDDNEFSKPAVRRCHSILNYQLYRSKPEDASQAKQWRTFPRPIDLETTKSGPFSVILNPNHPLFLRTEDDLDEIQVGRCRAVMVHHPSKPELPEPQQSPAGAQEEADQQQGRAVKFLPNQSNECVLHVYPCRPRSSLLCLSLGDTKLEAALWQSGQSPATDWEPCEPIRMPTDAINDPWSRLTSALRGLLAGAVRLLERQQVSCDEIEVALTWPGHIREKFAGNKVLVSTTLGEVDKVKLAGVLSSLLPERRAGTAEIITRLTKRLDELSRTADPFHCLSDAQLAALGEYRHPLGSIPDSTGMVLNIGSGICAGFFDTDNAGRFKGQFDSTLLAAASAIGRWLLVNPLTGKREGVGMDNLREEIIARVFQQVPPKSPLLPLSPFLSSRGLALRFLARIRLHDQGEFTRLLKLSGLNSNCFGIDWEEPKDEPIGGAARFKAACYNIINCPGNGYASFKPHLLFHAIGMIAANNKSHKFKPIARSFIREVAAEIAAVIDDSRRLLPQLNNGSGDALPDFAKCFQHVVLTGSVGQSFGWAGGEDLFCTTIMDCLRSSPDPNSTIKVMRSRIAVASVRETEGFQHYFTIRQTQ